MATLQTCEASMRVHDSKPAYRSNVNARQAAARVGIPRLPLVPANMLKQQHDVPAARGSHHGRRTCAREFSQPVGREMKLRANSAEQLDGCSAAAVAFRAASRSSAKDLGVSRDFNASNSAPTISTMVRPLLPMRPSCPRAANAIRSRLCCLDRSSVIVIGHLGLSGEREQEGKRNRCGADHHPAGSV
jgi:hypothetical protein